MSEITELIEAGAVVSGKPVRENGRLVCSLRCRIPVQLDVANDLSLRNAPQEVSDTSVNETKVEEPESYRVGENEVLVLGVASSTSVDWHGTEMSLQALQRMVTQFKRGVSHVPSHVDDEWDQMI